MPPNLTPDQKELLRELVKHKREGTLNDDFLVIPRQDPKRANAFINPIQLNNGEEFSFSHISDLDALCEDEHRLVSYKWNNSGKNKLYSIRQAGENAVDNDFELPEQTPTIEIGNIIAGDVGGDAIGRDKAGGDIIGRDKLEIEKQINLIVNTQSPIGLDVPCLKIVQELRANTTSGKKGIQFTDNEPGDVDNPPLLYIQIHFVGTNPFGKATAADHHNWLSIEANMRPALNIRMYVVARHQQDVDRLMEFLRTGECDWSLLGPGLINASFKHLFRVWREKGEKRLMISTFTETGAGISIHARFTDDVAKKFADYLEKVGFTEPFKDENEANDQSQ